MSSSASAGVFPRHIAVLLLIFLGSCFAGNHIAARIAFDNETGLLLAILCRSGISFIALAAVVLWQRQRWTLPAGAGKWQLTLGLLIMVQSICLYSAVARIPVALALLVANVFPILLALLTWALGGRAPTRRASVLMGIILIGLLFVLDVPARLSSAESVGPEWVEGIVFALMAACVFACGLWISEHKLTGLAGSVRSVYTIGIVFCSMVIAGASGIIPGGMSLPANETGWLALGALAVLYTMAFSSLFVFVHKLDMARNAPVMNIEPVATLLFGWALLDQMLTQTQMIGGAIVISCIVLLTYRKHG
jgi:drug/metabolite transporter (DMT)-like permease